MQQDYFKKSVVANSILFQFGDALKASLQDDNVIINRGSAKTILSENEVFIQAPLVTVNGNSSRFQTVTSNTITPAV